MVSPLILRDVMHNPLYRPYARDVFCFLDYLRTTERCKIRLHAERITEDGYEDYTPTIPYGHRWTVPYRKGIIKKFYQLEEWCEVNPSAHTLMSLTTYQNGLFSESAKGHRVEIPESFDILKNGWKILSKAVNYYCPDIPWVWVMEPHKTGYPHLHVIIFDDLSIGTRAAIKNLWTRKYQAGSSEHGIDFESRSPEHGITSVRNYLMKYLSSGFLTTGSKYGEHEPWTAGQLVFYALVRKNGWRLFDASRELRQVMRCKTEPDPNTEYYATEFLNGEGKGVITWLKSGFEMPVIIPIIESDLT